jgi:hypothetical protein
MTADRQGVLEALNIAAPVLEGREGALKQVLNGLPKHDESPLARLGTVHFGRWSLIGDWPEPKQWTLWFSADIEGTVERFVSGVRLRMPVEAEAIWRHCVDWPGADDPAALERWFLGLRVPTHYVIAAYPQATLADCRRAHARRGSLVELAIEAQRMARDDVVAAFRERFGELST